jgi:hypothetical protein
VFASENMVYDNLYSADLFRELGLALRTRDSENLGIDVAIMSWAVVLRNSISSEAPTK